MILYLFSYRLQPVTFEYLINNDIDTIKWEELDLEKFNQEFRKTRWGRARFKDNLNFFMPMRNTKLVKDYGQFWGITEIFKKYASGVKFRKDKLLVKKHYSAESVIEMLKDMKKLDDKDLLKKYNFKETYDWKLKDKRQYFYPYDANDIQAVHYRPFDFRYTYYPLNTISNIIVRGDSRKELMQYFLRGENIGVVFKRSRYLKPTEFHHFFVLENLVDINFLDDQTYIAPLHIYKDKQGNTTLFDDSHNLNKLPNFKDDFQKFIRGKYSFNPSPEEILGYIYAVFYSHIYRDKYLELLKIDFPRVPFVNDDINFKKLSSLGVELIEHHLMKKSYPKNQVNFPVEGTDTVENIKFKKDKVYINNTQYFANIPFDVWDFYIGGYQVLDKWLKSRKERLLSYEEKETFIKIANILEFTIKQMEKIDEVMV